MLKKALEVFLLTVIVFGVAGAYFKFVGGIPFSVSQVSTTKNSTFDVSGVGKSSIAPDEAVIDLGIRKQGKTVKEALGILEYTNKAASPAISKVVKSAAQNAVYNNDADAEKLYVKAIFVDEGPILKRFAARAKGSGTRILKRTCHITCVVDER